MLKTRLRPPVAPEAAPPVRARENEETDQNRLWDQLSFSGGAVQRHHSPGGLTPEEGAALPAEVEAGIHSARGGGVPLDADTRSAMEESFRTDFSGVRIHADARAERLSRSIAARAFTTGADVFFRGGEYRPSHSAGRELLAHELAHVVQQGGQSGARGASRLAPADDSHEREARRVAGRVAAGGGHPLSAGLNRGAAGRIQRDLMAYERDHTTILPSSGMSASVSSITYTAEAARLRAALATLKAAGKVGERVMGNSVYFSGSGATAAEVTAAFTAAGVPRAADLADALLDRHDAHLFSRERGADVTSLFWTTRISTRTDVLERQADRPLTEFERGEGRRVFGPSLDYDAVRVLEDSVMSVGGYARTLPNRIYFPTGSSSSSTFMPWLIHELTHVWQYRHGYGVGTTLYHAIRGNYDYGGEAALVAATAAGKGFRSFNTEQQGDILQDYYTRLKAGQDTTAWDPFVAEVRSA